MTIQLSTLRSIPFTTNLLNFKLYTWLDFNHGKVQDQHQSNQLCEYNKFVHCTQIRITLVPEDDKMCCHIVNLVTQENACQHVWQNNWEIPIFMREFVIRRQRRCNECSTNDILKFCVPRNNNDCFKIQSHWTIMIDTNSLNHASLSDKANPAIHILETFKQK